MALEGVFRFVSLRAAVVSELPQLGAGIRVFDAESPFYRDVHERAGESSARAVRDLAERFMETAEYLSSVDDAEGAPALLTWFAENADEPAAGTELPPPQPEHDLLRRRIADSLLADAIVGRPATAAQTDRKTLLAKLLTVVVTDEEPRGAPGDVSLRSWLARRPLLLPVVIGRENFSGDALRPSPRDGRVARGQDAVTVPTRKQLLAAHRTFAGLVRSPDATRVHGQSSPVQGPEAHTGLETVHVRLTEDAAKGVDSDSKLVATSLGLKLTEADPRYMVRSIERAIAQPSSTDGARAHIRRVIAFGGALLDEATLRAAMGLPDIASREPLTSYETVSLPFTLPTCKHAVGIGDLLIVKQQTTAYELAEFAHVENVLAGERKERSHRRLNRREETFTRETEHETRTERDLQTTDRNELQTEAERVVRSEVGLDAGLEISGSYGPTISFTSSVDASFSTTTEEATRRAATFSREVVEKTAERVRERIREETVTRIIQETEETNIHELQGATSPGPHTRGIFRWLNKVQEAQVLRYGRRMMFEFVVPEPAAFFLYSIVESPPEDAIIEKPDPPMVDGSPLSPSDLDIAGYQDFVAEYGVTAVPAPPPEFVTVSHTIGEDASGQEAGSLKIIGRTQKLSIPAGYEAYSARILLDYTIRRGESARARVMIGGAEVTSQGTSVRDLEPTTGEVALTVLLDDVYNFTLGVDVHCQLTAQGLAKWQHEVYDAIIEAYERKRAAYEEQLRAREIQDGMRVLGRNPLENRAIIRRELKKNVLHLFTGGVYLGSDAFLPGLEEPVIDVAAACESGKGVQFFETCFEWRNMQFVLYPYFWGRRARWMSAIRLTDPDLDFAAFLSAGAARVQVPVRPGFEQAVAHYCQTGRIWAGGDAPLLDDELYVPIVDEIAESLGRDDGGVPVPEGAEPWEVRLPTQLVLVQDLEEVPSIRDILTGSTVTLGPAED